MTAWSIRSPDAARPVRMPPTQAPDASSWLAPQARTVMAPSERTEDTLVRKAPIIQHATASLLVTAPRALGVRILRGSQRIVMHASMQAACCTPGVAAYRDLTRPIGPTWLNPLGVTALYRLNEAYWILAISNGVIAPALAHGLLLAIDRPRWMRRSNSQVGFNALVTGALGAMVGVLFNVGLILNLDKKIAAQKMLYDWGNGGFPDSYYWHAAVASAVACLPITALLSFYGAAYIDSKCNVIRETKVRFAPID